MTFIATIDSPLPFSPTPFTFDSSSLDKFELSHRFTKLCFVAIDSLIHSHTHIGLIDKLTRDTTTSSQWALSNPRPSLRCTKRPFSSAFKTYRFKTKMTTSKSPATPRRLPLDR